MEDVVVGRRHGQDRAQDARLGLVAGGVIASYRATLVERELWTRVSARFGEGGAFDPRWLDDVKPDDWVDAAGFVHLIEVLGDTLGIDGLRSLVRKRVVDPSGSNFYAPILRSWARSFGKSPEHMLRGVVHVWRAALRRAGRVRHSAVRPGEVHLMVEGPLADSYRRSPALAAELEGLAFSLLDAAQPRPVFVEIELRREQSPLALVCSFRN